jgi:hypothetical protein
MPSPWIVQLCGEQRRQLSTRSGLRRPYPAGRKARRSAHRASHPAAIRAQPEETAQAIGLVIPPAILVRADRTLNEAPPRRDRLPVPQVCRLLRCACLRNAGGECAGQHVLHLPGEQIDAAQGAAREGGRGGHAGRDLHAGDRAPPGLDEIAAGRLRWFRATAHRIPEAPAPGPCHHRRQPARRERSRAAAGIAP